MDIGSKLYSSILCTRLFKIIKRHGVKYQFGLTPGVGCQDGSFTLKTLLQLQHNHNLPTWILFADLVKAFDTSNHELIISILKKYGCPRPLYKTIQKMYKDSVVKLILGNKISIPFTVGVKQGDSIAPVLFLFLMMAFAESLDLNWKKKKLQKLVFQRYSNSPREKGQITGHLPRNFSKGSLFELFCLLYIDDGAFTFTSRRELIKGANLIRKQFLQFGLEMHVGNNKTASKSEIVFSPQAFLNKPFFPLCYMAKT